MSYYLSGTEYLARSAEVGMDLTNGRIFICYRRSDSRHIAGRVYDTLATRFSEDKVFMDVDAIEPGLDFTEEIIKAVESCRLLLAIIGPGWLTATDRAGRRRLDNPADFVRIEIETALNRSIRTIPVLVDGTAAPHPDDLPSSMAGLARRQAVALRHERYHDDARYLLTIIERALGAPSMSDGRESSSTLATLSDVRSTEHFGRRRKLTHSHDIDILAFSSDGTLLGAAGDDTVHIWATATGEESYRLHHGGRVNSIIFNPRSPLIATCCSDDTAHVWDSTTGDECHRLIHDDAVGRIAFSPDGTLLATASVDDYSVHLWSTLTGEENCRLDHGSQLSSFTFSPNGSYLVTTSHGGAARTWDLTTGEEHNQFVHDGEHGTYSASFSPDGSLIATSSISAQACIWNALTGEKLYDVDNARSNAPIFSPDGRLLAAAGDRFGSFIGRSIALWDLADKCKVRELQADGVARGFRIYGFTPDGVYLAALDDEFYRNHVYIWDVANGRQTRRYYAKTIAFSPDSYLIATSLFGDVRIRQLR